MRFAKVIQRVVRASALPLWVAACAPADDGESIANESKLSHKGGDIYDKTEALTMTLSAPLSTLFARLAAGQADAVENDAAPVGLGDTRPFSELGKLTVKGAVDGKPDDRTFDVRVSVRGESTTRRSALRRPTHR